MKNPLTILFLALLGPALGAVSFFVFADHPAAPWLALAVSIAVITGALLPAIKRFQHIQAWVNDAQIGLEKGPFGILFTKASGKPLYANGRIAELLGRSVQQILNSKTSRESTYSLPAELYQEITEQLEKGCDWTGEIYYPNASPNGRMALTTIKPIFDDAKRISHVLTLAEDIGDQNLFSRRMFVQANYDETTGLPNRIRSMQQLKRSLEKARRTEGCITLAFIDIDRTKLLNDSLGHETADKLFFEISQRLRQHLQSGDFLGHVGGDKFLMALADERDEEAVRRAGLLKTTIKEPMRIEDREINITASIGTATYPDDADDAEQLMHCAESAMYTSKEKGGDCISRYRPVLDNYAASRLSLETKLRYAIERNELDLYYQPVIDLKTNQLCGSEVLLRWHGGDDGELVPPDEFIPIAEETGLILSIGDWVLEQACHQAIAWQLEGMEPISVAINISARQFEHDHILHSVKRVLDETGLPPHMLELEITERLLINDDDETRELMHRLKGLGVRLSLDDFGTGYASLSYLKHYPFDVLKIDRSFIADARDADDSRQLTYAIIAMAHSLGMKVIAEGVEELEQRRLLKERGCDMAQGYLFTPAVSATHFLHWAMQYQALNSRSA